MGGSAEKSVISSNSVSETVSQNSQIQHCSSAKICDIMHHTFCPSIKLAHLEWFELDYGSRNLRKRIMCIFEV